MIQQWLSDNKKRRIKILVKIEVERAGKLLQDRIVEIWYVSTPFSPFKFNISNMRLAWKFTTEQQNIERHNIDEVHSAYIRTMGLPYSAPKGSGPEERLSINSESVYTIFVSVPGVTWGDWLWMDGPS